MEFGEKLQELRKNKGLTQEELAEVLYVSRTAVSKWESGRGYPNIQSLKDLADFFGVSIDDLLSGEKLLLLAEKENKRNIKTTCDLWFGIVDLFSVLLMVLPLYPNQNNGFVFSVNLFHYTQTTLLNQIICWVLIGVLLVFGVLKIVLQKPRGKRGGRLLLEASIITNVLLVLVFCFTRIVYGGVVAFFLLLTKGVILIKRAGKL